MQSQSFPMEAYIHKKKKKPENTYFVHKYILGYNFIKEITYSQLINNGFQVKLNIYIYTYTHYCTI